MIQKKNVHYSGTTIKRLTFIGKLCNTPGHTFYVIKRFLRLLFTKTDAVQLKLLRFTYKLNIVASFLKLRACSLR